MSTTEQIAELLDGFAKLKETLAEKKAELDAAQDEVARAVDAANAVEKQHDVIATEVAAAEKYIIVIQSLMIESKAAIDESEAEYKNSELAAFRSFAAEVGLPEEDRDRYEKERGITPEEFEVVLPDDISQAAVGITAEVA